VSAREWKVVFGPLSRLVPSSDRLRIVMTWLEQVTWLVGKNLTLGRLFVFVKGNFHASNVNVECNGAKHYENESGIIDDCEFVRSSVAIVF
jgi:hypothetical protein